MPDRPKLHIFVLQDQRLLFVVCLECHIAAINVLVELCREVRYDHCGASPDVVADAACVVAMVVAGNDPFDRLSKFLRYPVQENGRTVGGGVGDVETVFKIDDQLDVVWIADIDCVDMVEACEVLLNLSRRDSLIFSPPGCVKLTSLTLNGNGPDHKAVSNISCTSERGCSWLRDGGDGGDWLFDVGSGVNMSVEKSGLIFTMSMMKSSKTFVAL